MPCAPRHVLLALAALAGCTPVCDEPALAGLADVLASPDRSAHAVALSTLTEVCPGLPPALRDELLAAHGPYDPLPPPAVDRTDDPAWTRLLVDTCPNATHPQHRPPVLADLDGAVRLACDPDRFRLLADDASVQRADVPAFMLFHWLVVGRVDRRLAARVVRPLLTAGRLVDAGLTLSRGTSDVALAADALELRLSPTSLALDGADLLPLTHGRPADVVPGHVVPALQAALADIAAPARARADRDERPWPARIRLLADRAAPSGTLLDVLHTAVQAGYTDFELAVDDGRELHAQHLSTPRAWLPPDDGIYCGPDLDLVFIVHQDSLEIRTGPGRGTLVPRPAACDPALTGCHDLAAVREAVNKFKKLTPNAVVATLRLADDVPLQAVVALVDAVRGDGCRLTPALRGEKVPDACLFWQVVIDAEPPRTYASPPPPLDLGGQLLQ